MSILFRILLTGLGLFAVAHIVPGVAVADYWPTAVVAAIVFAVVNTFVKPVVFFLTIPFTILTLGIFYFIVNAGMFALTAHFVQGFSVDGFGSALLGALCMSLIGLVFGGGRRRSDAVEEEE